MCGVGYGMVEIIKVFGVGEGYVDQMEIVNVCGVSDRCLV